MSLKLFKPQEGSLPNPELESSSSVDGFPKTHQRKWRNTWSFRLEKEIPLNYDVSWTREGQRRKKMMKKYYGRKIPDIMEPRDLKKIVSYSKLLKFVRIGEDPSLKKNLKSKGNLVILANRFQYKKNKSNGLEENNRILLKKIVKYCEKAEIKKKSWIGVQGVNIVEWRDLILPRYLFAAKHVQITMNSNYDISWLGGIFCKLRNLETIKFQIKHSSVGSLRREKPKTGFFASLHKLSNLKKVKLIIDPETLGNVTLKQDLEKFYDRPHDFTLSFSIKARRDFEKKVKPGILRILNTAEYLNISDCEDHRALRDGDYVKMLKEEKRRMKHGKKNYVKIVSDEIDVLKLLSYCDSLENLYLRNAYDNRISWNISSGKDEIKALRNLKAVALEFSSFVIEDYQENVSEEEYSLFSSPLLMIFSELKEKCPSLQHLSLYLSTMEALNLEWVQENCPDHISSFHQIVQRFGQEVSAFDKLKTLGLLMFPDDFQRSPFGEILKNKSLESFQVKFSSKTKGSHPNWEDNCFLGTENNSEMKRLGITIPERKKIPLFRVNLLDYIQTLDNLEIVELIDKNLEMVTFDFLYGLVTSLLDKKNMKKILICTKVMNTFYSENYEVFLPKSLGNHLKNMLNEISEGLESRVEKLKEGMLEEILVGKLQNYGFDYLLFNKEMRVTEKLFWTEKEMEELLREKRGLARRYKEVFELFNKKEEVKRGRDEDDEDSD